jgi:hypothetical protein
MIEGVEGEPGALLSRELPAPQATRRGRPPTNRRKSAPSGGPAPAPRQVASSTKDMREWLALRSRVKAEQLRRGLSLEGVAAALGLAPSTVQAAIGRCSPASSSIRTKLAAFVTGGPEAPQEPDAARGGNGAAEPPAAPGPANGQAAAAADALAVRLRRKRRPLPLTGSTLAATIGCTPDELDDALRGRPVPPQAVAQLQGWLAAG